LSIAKEEFLNEVRALSDEASAYVQALMTDNEELRTFVGEKEDLLRAMGQLHSQCLELHDSEAQLHNELGRIYVSATQLSSSISRPSIICAIEEIVINLIGSEEVVILSNESEHGSGREPKVLSVLGVESDWIERRSHDWACVEGVLQTGTSYYADDRDENESIEGELRTLSACIALRAGERVAGAVAIFRLLPQKQAITKSDQDLCEIVATLGGQALYCSELHERLRRHDE